MVTFYSKATFALQKAYLNFQIFRRKKMFISNLVLEILLIAIIVINIVTKNYYLVGAAGILVLVNVFVFLKMIQKIYRVNLHQKDFSKIDILEVQIDYDIMHVINKRTEEAIDMPLDKLLEICELESYVFFYINDAQAFVLDKMDVIEGSIEDFLENLKEKRPELRIKKYYKS